MKTLALLVFVLSFLTTANAASYNCEVEGSYEDATGFIFDLPYDGAVINVGVNKGTKFFGNRCTSSSCYSPFKQWGLRIDQKVCDSRNEPCDANEKVLKLSILAPNGQINPMKDPTVAVYADPYSKRISLQSWGHNLFVFCKKK